MEKLKTDMIIAFAVSRKSELPGVRDLLNAVEIYFKKIPPVIIINNGYKNGLKKPLRKFQSKYSNIHLLENYDVRPFKDGLLAWLISRCMKYALDHFKFEAFLKIDPDTLIIGPDLDTDICNYLKNNPDVGQLGSYQYNCNYVKRDCSTLVPRFYTDPSDFTFIFNKIKENNPDFTPGMHAQGGGVAYSYSCVKKIIESPPIKFEELKNSYIFEDVLFSTYTVYLNFQIHSFVDPAYPFAIAWKGLPMPIKKLRSLNKKLIHSLKNNLHGIVKRKIFAAYRNYDKKHLI